MRRRSSFLCLLAVVALSSCATRQTALPTPLPTLQSFEGILPATTPSPSASVSPSPSATAAVARGAASTPATKRTAVRAAGTSRVQCPSGRVGAEVDDFSSSADDPAPNGDGRWSVTVTGTATNGTSAAVRSVQLVVTVHASNARSSSQGVTVGQTIGPGATVGWSTTFRYRADESPSEAQVSVAGWSWANSSLASCPR